MPSHSHKTAATGKRFTEPQYPPSFRAKPTGLNNSVSKAVVNCPSTIFSQGVPVKKLSLTVLFAVLALAALSPIALRAQQDITGTWQGMLVPPAGPELRTVVKVAK